MIVTIDGPAGSGKSTAARELAARLGIAYLDTGAMYRAVAHVALERGVDLADSGALLAVAESLDIEVNCGPSHTRVCVDGRDVTDSIRGIAVSAATSDVARNQGVRDLMVRLQREIGRGLGSLVADGRDQGSVVFPQAKPKFVLEASLKKRAERRCEELIAQGEGADLKSVMDNLRARDLVDARQWEPLLTEGEAIIIDTTDLTIDDVVGLLARTVERINRSTGAR